jgi:AhpD family alkylhydroperoxidase
VTEFHATLKQMSAPTRDLRRHIPETWAGFVQLAQSAVADGAIPGRIKEAFAVAIAVIDGCEGCIAHHAKAAVKQGTTEQEMAEAIGVALLMGGGPASTMAPTAWAAFQEFREAALTE